VEWLVQGSPEVTSEVLPVSRGDIDCLVYADPLASALRGRSDGSRREDLKGEPDGPFVLEVRRDSRDG
jgi:hypothetical protein